MHSWLSGSCLDSLTETFEGVLSLTLLTVKRRVEQGDALRSNLMVFPVCSEFSCRGDTNCAMPCEALNIAGGEYATKLAFNLKSQILLQHSQLVLALSNLDMCLLICPFALDVRADVN